MPEIVIKYKNKKSLEALKDLSKYLNFFIINKSSKQKNKVLKDIEQGLKEVKMIEEKKLNPITMKELLNEL